MKLFIKFLLLFLIINQFYSCKKENWCDCIKGSGNDLTEERVLKPFDKILIQDKLEVHLLKGNKYGVKLIAGSKVISLIETEIENGKLILSDNNTCDFTRSYKRKVKIYITVPKLINLQHDGSGDVFMDDLFECDTLNYYLSGSGNLFLNLNAKTVYGGMHGLGDVFIKGKVISNYIYASGQGFFNASETYSNEMILTLNTSGKMEVNVLNFLKVDMLSKSTGNVYYTGNPSQIITNLKGKGKLIKQ
jgi:hypothetical protein